MGWAWLSPAHSDDAATSSASEPCQTASTIGHTRDITCAIKGAEQVQRYRFIARFSRSHDDTRAWMTVRLNEQPLACEPGSKTDLEGEEGDVSIQCTFVIAAGTERQHRFAAQVSWSHAEYTGFALEPG